MDEQTLPNSSDDLINILLTSGLSDGLPTIAEKLLNAAMQLERAKHLNAQPHQRVAERSGYANGFKKRNFNSTMGKLELQVPQVRDCSEPFHTTLFEQGSRSDRALKAAIASMYIQGVSTRRVTKILESMCGGLQVSSTQVSNLTAELDTEFTQWRERELPEIAHLIVDATYYKVRIDGCVRDCATLIAVGVRREDGKRMVLGVSCALSEAEVHWREFFTDLKKRGVGIPDSITSDAHSGLKAALKATFNASPWQRCQFHLQQNAQAYVPKESMKKEVAETIRNIFNANDLNAAGEQLAQAIDKYKSTAPKLATWMEDNLPEGFTVFSLASNLRKRLRTSNMCETLNSCIKRRTRVVGLFPNEASLERLVTAVLMEISEDWETGKTYLTLN